MKFHIFLCLSKSLMLIPHKNSGRDTVNTIVMVTFSTQRELPQPNDQLQLLTNKKQQKYFFCRQRGILLLGTVDADFEARTRGYTCATTFVAQAKDLFRLNKNDFKSVGLFLLLIKVKSITKNSPITSHNYRGKFNLAVVRWF